MFVVTVVALNGKQYGSGAYFPIIDHFLFLMCMVSLATWDVLKWDARDDSSKICERQMDSFWGETIFPQKKNRGRILFAVDGETPLQSRFAFLTGSYADETINIGEIFYKGQYQDAMRRKTALLYGRESGDLSLFSKNISTVYSNIDTLAARMDYLCKKKKCCI